MTKKEIIDIVAEKAEISKKAAKAAVDAFIEAIEASLEDGKEAAIAGFGTFKVKTRAARKGVNPQTNAPIEIPETKNPVFKPAKAFKDKVAK